MTGLKKWRVTKMPNKKPTDAEIVKALKKTKYRVDGVALSGFYLDTEMFNQVVDLINRLKSDCENYKQVAENQQKVTLDRWFEIKRLKEEIEKLEKEVKADEYILKEIICDEKTYNFVTNDVSERLKTKTEAYTDFAESLKKDFDNPRIQKFGLDFVKFLKNIVDNRLKELVGEGK
jgi:hypothetical protein